MKASALILLPLIAACAAREPAPLIIPERPAPVIENAKIDSETLQKIEHILERIYRLSERTSLENLGRGSMSESVALMDIGEPAARVISMKLKEKNNWRYRFWLVDMLGYVGGEGNITPLIEVVEDSSENIRVRLRAAESLRELRLSRALPALLISRDIVADQRVLEEINKSIEYLR